MLAGAIVVEAPQGQDRSHPIRSGTEKAAGDVILGLHADACMQHRAGARLFDGLKRETGVPGRALGMTLPDSGAFLRLLAFLNNLRSKYAGLAIGDQISFFRCQALAVFSGLPDCMLMEDVGLCPGLKELGAPLLRWGCGGLSAALVPRLQDGQSLVGARAVSGEISVALLAGRAGHQS